MIDIKNLYLELINDFDPYTDLKDHEDLSESEMLYNLINIREFFDIDTDEIIKERFEALIYLFKSMGINPYYD